MDSEGEKDMNHQSDKVKAHHEPMETDCKPDSDDPGGGGAQQQQQPLDTSMEPEDPDAEIDDDDSRPEAVLTFAVENFSRMKEKEQVLSDSVMVRNLPWKIMVMHRVNQNGKTLGFFLQCNADSDATSWSVQAIAELRLVHPSDPSATIKRKIQHLFYCKENDWGFSHYIGWNEVFEKGFVKDEAIDLEVKVMAEAPHGVSWDSKKYTGYVGLKNQGATCYMNSLLQTLYFTKKLRRAVYLMPTETDDASKSVPLAMQRVFYDLQFCDKPVGTKKLTKSFGWETLDSFMQHDVQELSRVLLDNMESKMKGTIVGETIPKLFQGEMESYIRCKNVVCQSTRTEEFYDIQLKVKCITDLVSSFKDYIAVETLDGDNKYDAGKLGMQEAEKGVRFLRLPPVLHLQLMRFQYDAFTDSNIKINDKFEFPERLELDEFLSKPESTPAIYRLHSVLVHTGDNHGGHYIAFISPKCNGRWFRFDDDVVSKSTRAEAINSNFGGQDEDLSVRHCTNAYMLVYIRESAMAESLCEVTEEDIPQNLHDRFSEEKKQEVQRRKERTEAHLYMTVSLLTDDTFSSHQGPDLYDPEKSPAPPVIRVKKSTSVSELMEVIAEHMRYPLSHLRLWPMNMRQNQTFRPVCINYEKDVDKKIVDMADLEVQWMVYIEVLPPDQPGLALPPFDSETDVLLFMKRYCPKTKTLAYCGHIVVSLHQKMTEMFPIMNERAGFPKGTELLLYEEVRPLSIEPIMKMDVKVAEMLDEIMDGDILVFQRREPDLAVYECPTPREYYRDLHYRMEVHFVDKHNVSEPGFVLTLSQKHSYDQMAQAAARHLDVDPLMLQFFKTTPYKEGPGNAIKCTYEGMLRDLFNTHSIKARHPKRLYYQKLSMLITELENKRQFRCTFMSLKLQNERELVLYPEKHGKVRELLEEARKQLTLSVPPGSGRLRLVELIGHKIYSVLPESEELPETVMTAGSKSFRVEEVRQEEVEPLDPAHMLVPCAHFNKEIYQAFGVPFLLRIKNGEPFSAVRERIQKRLEVLDKEFKTYKFAIVVTGCTQTIWTGEEAEKEGEKKEKEYVVNLKDFMPKQHGGGGMSTRPHLGIDHVNRAPKRQRYNYFEKAIKIHN